MGVPYGRHPYQGQLPVVCFTLLAYLSIPQSIIKPLAAFESLVLSECGGRMSHEETSQLILQERCGSGYPTTNSKMPEYRRSYVRRFTPMIVPPEAHESFFKSILPGQDIAWSYFLFCCNFMRGWEATCSPTCNHFEYHPQTLLRALSLGTPRWGAYSIISLARNGTS